MKYRDIITLFLSLIFFLSLGYAVGVDNRVWFIPVILLIVLLFFVYKLWFEKE